MSGRHVAPPGFDAAFEVLEVGSLTQVGCEREGVLEHLHGVVEVTAGYAGGSQPNPDYELVETGKTGYAESVQVIYEPARISYDACSSRWAGR